MIGRQEQILAHEVFSAASGALGTGGSATTYASKQFPWGQEVGGMVLVTKTGAAPTGTTPGLTPVVQISDNGGAFATITAGTQITTATMQALAITNAAITTAITSYNATHTYMLKVLVTAGNADNVCTDLSIDIFFVN